MYWIVIKQFFSQAFSIIVKNIEWVLAMIIIGICLYGYHTYKDKITKIETLKSEKALLEKDISTLNFKILSQTDLIDRLEKDRKQIKVIRTEITKQKQVLDNRTKILLQSLEKNDKFDALIYNQPELVQKIINQATKERIDCATEITKFNSSYCITPNNSWMQ